MDRLRVHLSGSDRRARLRAVQEVGADLCFGSGRAVAGTFTIDGILLESQLAEATATLTRAGVSVVLVGPVHTAPRSVATGDRFSRRGALPRGLGAKE